MQEPKSYYNETAEASQPVNQSDSKNKTALIIAISAVVLIIAVALIVVLTTLNSESWLTRVPNVIEIEYEDAAEKIIKSKLYCVISDKVESDAVTKDYVISQSPEAEKKVYEKSRVNVVLSAGAEKTYVPSLENYSYERAEKVLSDSGFEVKKIEKANSKYAPNTVHSQSIPEGLQEKGRTATLYVTPKAEVTSEAMAEVPNLSGKTFADAKTVLENVGLNIAVGSSEYSDTVSQNCVISQETPAGTKLPKGTSVYVKISKGGLQIFVPDITYRTEEKAVEALENAGLTVKEEHEENREVAKGTVIKQSIEENVKVPGNTEITAVISDGYEVVVPDVTGMDEKDAVYALFDAELTVNIVYAYNDTARERSVIAQEYKAGEKIQFGTPVTITVNKSNAEPLPTDNTVTGKAEPEETFLTAEESDMETFRGFMGDVLAYQHHYLDQGMPDDSVFSGNIEKNFFNHYYRDYDYTADNAYEYAYSCMFGNSLFSLPYGLDYTYGLEQNSYYKDYTKRSSSCDPLNKFPDGYRYTKFDGETFDMYLKSWFNVEPNHNISLGVTETGFYYHDGYYYGIYDHGGMESGPEIAINSTERLNDGKYRLNITYNYYDWEKFTIADLNVTAGLKDVNGTKMWSLYSYERA